MSITLEEKHETGKDYENDAMSISMELTRGEQTNKVAVFGVIKPLDVQLFHEWITKNMSASFYSRLRKRLYHEHSVAILEGREKP